MKFGFITAFIVTTVLLTPVLSPASEVVIITNKDVKMSTLTRGDVRQIFLGKIINWANGGKIVFVVQHGTDASEYFLRSYLRKNAYDYNVFWKKQVFTGKGKAPRSFSSDEEVIQFVSEIPGAIGYVSSDADTEKVSIVTVQ